MGYLLLLSKPVITNWLHGSEIALLVGGLVLLIGLLGEHFASAGGVWLKRFAALVTIGCGIEFLADGGVFLFSTHLQSISDAEVIAAENDAKQARDSARDANGRAIEASKEATRASGQATDAFGRAASAEKEAGEDKLGAERLRLLAEDEARKRVAIEQQLAWRTLTSEQRKHLGFPLPHEFVGTTLIVANPMGDAEGWSYARELWQALSKAGWGDSENPGLKGSGVGNPRALMFPTAVPQGLEVIERGEPEAGSFLWKTLLDCGIGVTKVSIPMSRSAFNLSTGPMSSGLAASVDATIPANTLELLVGVKPQPIKIIRPKQQAVTPRTRRPVAPTIGQTQKTG